MEVATEPPDQGGLDTSATRADWSSILAPAFVLVLGLAFSPTLNSTSWSLRWALVLALAAGGLPICVRLAWRSSVAQPAAAAGLVLVVLALVSALVSPRPWISLAGQYGGGGGSVVLVAGCVAAWAVCATTSTLGRDRVAVALLAVGVANALIGVLQGFVDLDTYRLPAPIGSTGLVGNPVHLAALLAGLVGLAAGQVHAGRSRWLLAIAIAGIALPFTGSRMGSFAAIIVALVWCRSKRGVVAVVVLIAALAAGEVLHTVSSATSASTASKLDRTNSVQLTQRLDAWDAAIDAARERILGVGPGRFLAASSPRTTLRQARAAPDTVYVDAHNLFFEYLGTVGFPGLVAFLAFLALVLWRARGPFLTAALGLLVVYLMQPQSLATIPLAFVALGAAWPEQVVERARPAAGLTVVRTALVLSSLLVGAAVAFGDFRLRQADLDFDDTDASAAAALLFPWPEPIAKRGVIAIFDATSGRADAAESAQRLEDAESSLAEAVARDPSVATHWSNLADLQLYREERDRARASFEAARRANPRSVRALVGLAATAYLTGDTAAGDRYVDQASEIVDRRLVERLVGERTGDAPDAS